GPFAAEPFELPAGDAMSRGVLGGEQAEVPGCMLHHDREGHSVRLSLPTQGEAAVHARPGSTSERLSRPGRRARSPSPVTEPGHRARSPSPVTEPGHLGAPLELPPGRHRWGA